MDWSERKRRLVIEKISVNSLKKNVFITRNFFFSTEMSTKYQYASSPSKSDNRNSTGHFAWTRRQRFHRWIRSGCEWLENLSDQYSWFSKWKSFLIELNFLWWIDSLIFSRIEADCRILTMEILPTSRYNAPASIVYSYTKTTNLSVCFCSWVRFFVLISNLEQWRLFEFFIRSCSDHWK